MIHTRLLGLLLFATSCAAAAFGAPATSQPAHPKSDATLGKDPLPLPLPARYGGHLGGTWAGHNGELNLGVVLQTDLYEGKDGLLKAPPLFVVIWKCSGGVSSGADGNKYLSEINHHPVSVPANRRAVYALHPDYTLKRLSMSAADLEHLFKLLDARNEELTLPVVKDPVFIEKVAPFLRRVEMWDASDPKNSAWQLVLAIEQGDSPIAKDIYSGGQPEVRELIEASGLAHAAEKKLGRAVLERFGDSVKIVVPGVDELKLNDRDLHDWVLLGDVKLSTNQNGHHTARIVAPMDQKGAPPASFMLLRNGPWWNVMEMPVPAGIAGRLRQAAADLDTIAEEVAADLYEHPYQVQAAVNRLRDRPATQPVK
jgi:hypothetical protein